MEVKAHNGCYQDMVLRANEAFLVEEQEKNMLWEAMCADLHSYRYNEAIHKDREERI